MQLSTDLNPNLRD